MGTTTISYVGVICYILGYLGILENEMETTISLLKA